MKKYYEWLPGILVSDRMMEYIHNEMIIDGEPVPFYREWLDEFKSMLVDSKMPVLREEDLKGLDIILGKSINLI